jgi:hypothetical protein
MPNKSSIYRGFESIIFSISGWPEYYWYVRHVLTLKKAQAILHDCGFRVVKSAYYGRTPVISSALRPAGLARYSDNMFFVVAQKLDGSQTG